MLNLNLPFPISANRYWQIVGKRLIKTKLHGEHNILNATAAIIASLLAKVPIKHIQKSLSTFQGVKRRFSFLGKINKASIFDEYYT